MTASFPTSIKSFTTKADNVTQVLAEHINSPQEEIAAIETLLGVNGGSWIGEGQMMNGKLAVSVATSDLTVAIKTMAGANASASDPIYVRINGTVRKITGALSVTKNDGTNWCNSGGAELATKETDYFVYLGYNATDGVVVGFSRIPSANIYSDFSTTSTNEKYCAISTITNAAAGDDYTVVGRFAATLSAGAGYTWTVPTFTTKNLIQRPIYESRWLLYTAGVTWTAGAAPTTPSAVNSYYKVNSNSCFVNLVLTWTGAGTTVTQATVTVPFTASPASQSCTGMLSNGAAANATYTSVTNATFLLICGSSTITRLFSNGVFQF